MITDILANQWRQSGVDDGDTVLVHSSIKRTIRHFSEAGYNITPASVLESLLLAIGKSGTLLLPLFNFDFAKGVPFDIRSTPSHMGVLTEAGRLSPTAVRTGHPLYSFAVIGQQAGRFRAVNNFSGYGSDSPFAMLREMGGKIAVLDLSDQNSMTFYHHVEEMKNIPYRYHKSFAADYTDALGETQSRSYGIFVRDIERGVQTHVDPAGELMWNAGLYHGDRPLAGSGMRTVLAQDMYDFVAHLIDSGRAENNLYRIEK